MIVEQQHPNQAQRPQPDPRVQAEHDRARERGNAIYAIAGIAEENLGTAADERAARTRYEDALQVLRWLVGAPWSERTVDGDRVLHDEHGSLDPALLVDYLDLILAGSSSLEARGEMRHRQKHAGHAAETRRAAEAARAVAAYHHAYADAPVAPQRPAAPALPPGAPAANGSKASALPKRIPAPPHPAGPAADVPPVDVPHVDEDPAWSTSQMIAELKKETAGGADAALNPRSVKALHDGGFGPQQSAGPDYGPTPDPRFAASAVPQLPATQRMPRVDPEATQAFDAFFGDQPDNAGNAGKDGEPVVLPFKVPGYAPEATERTGERQPASLASQDEARSDESSRGAESAADNDD